MFILVISCLTKANLSWLMDLTFQVPMQYYSLQHWTLLSPPDTSTNEHCFCFGPSASLFLELLVIVLHSSPVAYWTPFGLGEWRGHLPVIVFFAFSYCSWSSPGKNTAVGCHFLLQWTTFCLIASLRYASPFATRLWSMNKCWYWERLKAKGRGSSENEMVW